MGNPPRKKYPIGGGILSPARRRRSRIFAAAFRARRAAQKNSQCRRQTVRRGKNLWKAKRAFPAAIMLPSGAGARLFIDACRADFDNICAQISALPAQSGSGKRFAENKQAEKSKKKARRLENKMVFGNATRARAEIPAQARKKISETRKRGKPRFGAVLRKARAQKKRASPTGEPAFSGYFRYFTASM